MVKLTESIICSRTKVSALEMVRKLNCWGCDLDDIDILQHLPNVEVLSLSVNNIETLWPLAGCTNLRELYLRKNNISELRELRHLRRLSKLRVLWLSENPCADQPHYRYQVLSLLPSLTTLDNRPVTSEELSAVASYDQGNVDSAQDGSMHVTESSPECDLGSPEFGVRNGPGWQTVRVHPNYRPDERPVKVDRSNMSVSCYVPSGSTENGRFGGGGRNDCRQSMSTSVTSLYETHQDNNGFVEERACWQYRPPEQPRRGSTPSRNGAANTNPSNILMAIYTLLNELDKRELECVINEAEQRLQRM